MKPTRYLVTKLADGAMREQIAGVVIHGNILELQVEATQRQDVHHAAPHNAQHLGVDKGAAARKYRVSRPLQARWAASFP